MLDSYRNRFRVVHQTKRKTGLVTCRGELINENFDILWLFDWNQSTFLLARYPATLSFAFFSTNLRYKTPQWKDPYFFSYPSYNFTPGPSTKTEPHRHWRKWRRNGLKSLNVQFNRFLRTWTIQQLTHHRWQPILFPLYIVWSQNSLLHIVEL